ncbi:MAG: hypothetical protein OEW18_00440 [Candidatus Aminicenantes bacterium]|nr:hypothetical protein [Candidatus Aminicenantes bacterium]
MKKAALIVFYLVIVAAVIGAQQNEFPNLAGPYLGQKLPGRTPGPFAENIAAIHRFLHSGIVFSPDGKEAYWKPDWNPRSPIYFSKVENGYWTVPQVAPFSKGDQGDDSPFISPDGKKLFFISQRAQKRRESIWVMERTPQGWSEPRLLPDIINSMDYIHWQFSVDLRGNLYFSAGVRGDGREGYIHCPKFENGTYGSPERMGPEINKPGAYNYSPLISPDRRTLLFTRDQNPAKLYLSFRKEDGGWTEAVDLSGFLPDQSCLNPFLTSDGKYLFFLVGGRPFWVSAEFIEELRPKK